MARIELLVYSRQAGKPACSVLFEFTTESQEVVLGRQRFRTSIRASVGKGFRWGCTINRKAVKAIEDRGRADPILEFPNEASAQRASMTDLNRAHRSEKYLIRIRLAESDRWFGPIDSDVLFSDQEISLPILDKPDWTPIRLQENEGLYVAPHKAVLPEQKGTTDTTFLKAEIEACLAKTREEAVQASLQWLPQAIQQSDPGIWIESPFSKGRKPRLCGTFSRGWPTASWAAPLRDSVRTNEAVDLRGGRASNKIDSEVKWSRFGQIRRTS